MSNTLAAVSVAVDLLTLVAETTVKLQTVSAVLQKAHAEGREITDAELAGIKALDDEAKARLDAAIAKASTATT